jgi:hypothetical protein
VAVFSKDAEHVTGIELDSRKTRKDGSDGLFEIGVGAIEDLVREGTIDSKRITLEAGDFLDDSFDFSQYDVIYLYWPFSIGISKDNEKKLEDKLLSARGLKPGAVFILNTNGARDLFKRLERMPLAYVKDHVPNDIIVYRLPKKPKTPEEIERHEKEEEMLDKLDGSEITDNKGESWRLSVDRRTNLVAIARDAGDDVVMGGDVFISLSGDGTIYIGLALINEKMRNRGLYAKFLEKLASFMSRTDILAGGVAEGESCRELFAVYKKYGIDENGFLRKYRPWMCRYGRIQYRAGFKYQRIKVKGGKVDFPTFYSYASKEYPQQEFMAKLHGKKFSGRDGSSYEFRVSKGIPAVYIHALDNAKDTPAVYFAKLDIAEEGHEVRIVNRMEKGVHEGEDLFADLLRELGGIMESGDKLVLPAGEGLSAHLLEILEKYGEDASGNLNGYEPERCDTGRKLLNAGFSEQKVNVSREEGGVYFELVAEKRKRCENSAAFNLYRGIHGKKIKDAQERDYFLHYEKERNDINILLDEAGTPGKPVGFVTIVPQGENVMAMDFVFVDSSFTENDICKNVLKEAAMLLPGDVILSALVSERSSKEDLARIYRERGTDEKGCLNGYEPGMCKMGHILLFAGFSRQRVKVTGRGESLEFEIIAEQERDEKLDEGSILGWLDKRFIFDDKGDVYQLE